jgi:hypothetical protein
MLSTVLRSAYVDSHQSRKSPTLADTSLASIVRREAQVHVTLVYPSSLCPASSLGGASGGFTPQRAAL